MPVPYITFNDGNKMPAIGLGTYLSKAGEVETAVKDAIDIGYRHIDTAAFYENEKEVGNAIREKINEGVITRKDIFVTTKLWCNSHKQEHVVPACEKSLKNLGFDYVDLYLIHWPFAFQEGDDMMPKDDSGNILFSDTDYLETWKGMEECKRRGLAKSIGVSNFNIEQVRRVFTAAKIKPVNNQVEVTIKLNQKLLIDLCKNNGITVTGYAPLGRPGNKLGIKNGWEYPRIQKLVNKYGKTPAQIACRYVYQMGAAPIPKSVTKSRIQENFEIFDFSLTDEEMTSIQGMATGERVAVMQEARAARYYPFN